MTMADQVYDPSVAEEWDKVQGWQLPLGIIYRGNVDTRPAWWVPRENSFFRETLGESAPVGPRIGAFGGPEALHCQRLGQNSGVRPRGCCIGAMWVPWWIGEYPGENSFFRETVGTRVWGWEPF